MHDVVLVHWPEERHRLTELRRRGAPRLVLVADGADPPAPTGDPCEDWMRVPAGAADIHLRVATLRLRVTGSGSNEPAIDADGVVTHEDRRVPLPPVEARLMAVLVERGGAVVSRERLMRAGWPDSDPGRNALDVHVLRLRRRLAPIGLALRTVRSRGYMLVRTDSVQQAVS